MWSKWQNHSLSQPNGCQLSRGGSLSYIPPRRGASVMRRDPCTEITWLGIPPKGVQRVEDPLVVESRGGNASSGRACIAREKHGILYNAFV